MSRVKVLLSLLQLSLSLTNVLQGRTKENNTIDDMRSIVEKLTVLIEKTYDHSCHFLLQRDSP